MAKFSQLFRSALSENPVSLVDFILAYYTHAIQARCKIVSLYDCTTVGRHLAEFLIATRLSISVLTMNDTFWMHICHNFLLMCCKFRLVENPTSEVEHVDVQGITD